MANYSRSAIKEEAKSLVSKDTIWFHNFVAGLIVLVIPFVISIVSYFVIVFSMALYESTDYILVSMLLTLFALVSILIFPLQVTYEGYYQLNGIRYNDYKSNIVFKHGMQNFGKYLGLSLLKYLFLGLWSLLLIFPGMIKKYSYSMTSYIVADNPSLSANDIIKLSERITYNHKADLFELDLSFILWFLLAGYIQPAYAFVMPYYLTTKAMYYENLKMEAIENGIARPEEFGMYSNPYTQPEPQQQIDQTYNNQPIINTQVNMPSQSVNNQDLNNLQNQSNNNYPILPEQQAQNQQFNNQVFESTQINTQNEDVNYQNITNQQNQVNNGYQVLPEQQPQNQQNYQQPQKQKDEPNVFEPDRFSGFDNFVNKNNGDNSNSNEFEV